MGVAGGAASAISLAGLGLGALGKLTSAQGTATADTFQSELLERQAQIGELQATQTGAQMTRNLNIKLGNLDAIRAAAHDNPYSPTGAAVRDYESYYGTEEKNIKVDSIMAQAQMDEANAAYLREASSTALLSGGIGAAGNILSGISGSPLLKGGGSLGNSSIGNPLVPGALY